MTVVREDERGLYLEAGGRYARPTRGQADGVKAGRHVRARFMPGGLVQYGKPLDAVRVRYGGGEELWPAYATRRAELINVPPAFKPGQVWRRADGTEIMVDVVHGDGSMTSTGQGRYAPDGRNLKFPDRASRRLKHLISENGR